MRTMWKFAVVATGVGMIPAVVALYELLFAPATGQAAVVIPPHLWFTLCAFTPALLPLLSAFQGHGRAGELVFALLLMLSNGVVYGLCGLAIGFFMTKVLHVDRQGSPHASVHQQPSGH